MLCQQHVPYITCEPQILERDIVVCLDMRGVRARRFALSLTGCIVPQPGDEYLVIASDGVWDVMSNLDAVKAAGGPRVMPSPRRRSTHAMPQAHWVARIDRGGRVVCACVCAARRSISACGGVKCVTIGSSRGADARQGMSHAHLRSLAHPARMLT